MLIIIYPCNKQGYFNRVLYFFPVNNFVHRILLDLSLVVLCFIMYSNFSAFPVNSSAEVTSTTVAAKVLGLNLTMNTGFESVGLVVRSWNSFFLVAFKVCFTPSIRIF